MQSLTSQFYAFLVTILAGVIIGILFDFYRVVRGLVRPRKVFTHLGDLTFWVVSTLVIFFLLLVGNWGEMRFYVFIGILAGIGLYLKCLSRYFIKIFGAAFLIIRKILMLVAKVCSTLWLIIIYPFVIIRNIVVIPIGFLGRTCAGGANWVKKCLNRFIGSPVKGYISRVERRLKDRLIKYLKK